MTHAEVGAEPAIEITALARRYGAAFVLKNVNLRVGRGRVLVLHGSNGAGKTTLLRVLSTRLRPSRGEGRVFGLDLVKDAARVREHVAYLSVFGGAYGALSARENLALAARLYGKRESLEPYLEKVGLIDVQHKPVRTFSSGMKKRLGVARVLLSNADLWLLDEPYAALDESGRELVDDLLLRAKREGKTVVMASHELERSARLGDRVLEVHGGSLHPVSLTPKVAEITTAEATHA